MKGSPQKSKSDIKCFTDYKSLFSIVNCKNVLKSVFISDLLVTEDWVYQLKMPINTDQQKQAHEVILSWKTNKGTPFFTNSTVKVASTRKLLDLILNSNLSFSNHINDKINKALFFFVNKLILQRTISNHL